MIAGSLEIQMLANMAELRKQMDQGVSMVQSATAQMQKAADLAGKALGLIGVGLSMGAFTGFIRNAIDAADALDEMSGRIGVSAKELSGLQLAYKQAGMGNDAMASSIGKLSREMSEGNAGLRALGVSAKDAAGNLRTPTAVLLDVADKFQTLEDGAGKTALAMEIFGKSGAEMVPLLNSGSEGIREMMETAQKLGLVIEDETAAQAGQFNDTIELLGLGVQGVGTRIGAQLLPTLNSLTGSFLSSMTEGDRLSRVADILAAGMKGLYSVGLGVVEVFSTLGKSWGAVIGAFIAVRNGDFDAAKNILKEGARDIKEGWSATATAISKAWDSQGDASVAAAAKILKTNGDLLASQKARDEAAKKGAAAAEKALADQVKLAQDGAKLAASLLAQDSGLAPDFAEKWEKLNAARKAGFITEEKLILAQKELLEKQPAMVEAQKALVKASQEAADARNKEVDGIEAYMRAQEAAAASALKSVRDRVIALQEEEQAVSVSRALNISMAEAIERVAIARMQEKQAGFVDGSEGWQQLQKEIEARKELMGLIGKKDIREREEKGWTDMWQSVDNTAHDVFTNVFEGGSNVFKKLGQTLKASVLDLLYQMTVRKWIVSIGTSVMGSGFGAAANAATGGNAGGAGGGGGIMDTISNIGSIGSMFGAGGIGGSLAAGAGWLTGSTTLTGALGAGASLIGTGTAAGAMSGMGMIAGALGPIALGVGAIMALVKKFDDSGTFHTGALSEYSAAGGLASSTKHGAFGMGFGGVDYSAETEKFTGAMAQSIVQMLDSTATTFGKEAGYKAATAFADDTSKDGAWGGLLITKLEETIVNWDPSRTSKWAPKEFADGAAGKEQYLAAVAADVRVALESIGLPDWAKVMLDKLGSGATLEQIAGVVDQINAVKASFVSLGQYMPVFAKVADSALNKMVEASGGPQALAANMTAFMNAFMTEGERLAVATENVAAEFARLGFQMPRSRAELKDLVQAQMAMGDAGAETAAKLLSVAGAFAAVTEGSNVATSAIQAEGAERRAFVQARREMQQAEQQAEIEAIEASKKAAADLFETIKGHIASINDWLNETLLDSNSLLSPEGKVQEAQAQFDALWNRAVSGDADAMGQLTQAAGTLRDLARDAYASSGAYGAIETDIRARLGSLNAGMFDPANQKSYEENWGYSGNDGTWGGPSIAQLMEQGLSFEEASSLSSLRDDQGRYSSSLVDWEGVKGQGKDAVVDALRAASREMFIGPGDAQWSKWTSPEGLDYTRLAQRGGGFAQESAGDARGVYDTAYRFGLTDREARAGLSATGHGSAADGNWWSGNMGGVSQWVKSYGGGYDTVKHLADMQATANRYNQDVVNTLRSGGSASAQGQSQQISLLQSIDRRLAGQNSRMGALA